MATFDEELQIILDRHPEILEVKVKYKKGATFKPGKSTLGLAVQAFSTASSQAISSPVLEQKVAEMLKAGEL